MCIAEDIAATTTVMPTCEVAEVSCAGSVIADGRFGVRLRNKVSNCYDRIRNVINIMMCIADMQESVGRSERRRFLAREQNC